MAELQRRIWGVVVAITLAASGFARGQATSQWVYPGPDGKLVYKTTPTGDRIMDFSHAGYMGGGVPLPDVPVAKTVQPNGDADATAAIQGAINAVAAMPMKNGFHGAVLLAPGTFSCSKAITLAVSGVVLRGSGTGPDGTTIMMVGPRHAAIVIGRVRGRQADGGPSVDENEPASGEGGGATQFNEAHTSIADAYVPEGASSFALADAKGFNIGDTINIRRSTTAQWVAFMDMNTLKRDGKAQTWIGLNRPELIERKITAISGNQITLNVPLPDSYDAKLLGASGTVITKIRPGGRVTQVGIENLHIQCPPLETAYGQAPYSAIRIAADDCWVRNVYCQETMNSTTLGGNRITMQQVSVTHTFPNLGASKPTDFSIEGGQNLLDRCRITGDNMYFVWTASLDPGPNVLLNCTFRGRGSHIQPHMRWSTGMLVDNCTVPDGGIDFMNRGVAGSGHGWTMGWAVAWNCVAKTYWIQNPPGAANWSIGCIGTPQHIPRLFDTGPIMPDGEFDSPGAPVAPQSLYLAQLAERLGPGALTALGYSSNSTSDFPDKATPLLPPWPSDVDSELGPDLALHRPVNTNGMRDSQRQFEGEKAVDGDPATFWAPKNGVNTATLELDMEGPVDINAVALEEAAGAEGRITSYTVTGQVDSDWKLLSQGTTIGKRTVDRFPATTCWKVRLTILGAKVDPTIGKFGLYLAPLDPAHPSP